MVGTRAGGRQSDSPTLFFLFSRKCYLLLRVISYCKTQQRGLYVESRVWMKGVFSGIPDGRIPFPEILVTRKEAARVK